MFLSISTYRKYLVPKYEYVAKIGGKPFTKNTLKLLQILLEEANLGPKELAERLGITHSAVVYALRDKIEPLGGKYVYFLNPEKLGMKVAIARIKPEPAKIEDVAASLTLSPLVRQLFIEPTSDEIYAIVVGPEWKLREFKHRLRTTPHVREYQLLPLNVRKFEQPIPPELLDELMRGGEEE